ncbi:YfhL family 4Fe-4S dicluster ferredoxin [Caenispirillum bisanense]|uniref:YfhL family 4Fe-4S dicluster ferredoxin n=1 Tax=Caenispirillum bisanense TaxID=414052 RepID=UPI0031D98A7D
MAMMIGEDCIGCSGCVDDCPNMAIDFDGTAYKIDPAKCTECVGAFDEPQCAALCPTECVVPHPEFQEDRARLMEKRRLLLAS